MAKNPLGPVGLNVQANVKRFREEQNLSLVKLSQRLAAAGRPIPPLGLSRIENGERRVDSDDLVALATTLGVSPTTLLLPAEGDPGEPVHLTNEVSGTWQEAWRWATGDAPLSSEAADRVSQTVERIRWQEVNRPYLAEEERARVLLEGDDPIFQRMR